jgi:hypothetical protein
MADNTIINQNSTSGDTIRDIDRSGVKTQVVAIDIGGINGEILVDSLHPVPITDTTVNTSVQSVLTKTTSIDTVQGAKADTVWISGDGTVISVLKNVATKLASTIAITVASLPLPTGAATDTNLNTIAGVSGTALTQPSGGTGILGWLSGIYTKLQSSIAVSQFGATWVISQLPNLVLSAGSATIGKVGIDSANNGVVVNSGTVSLGTTDTTNLSAISTAQGTNATGVTQLSGGTGKLGWLSGIFQGIGTQADTAWVSGSGSVISIIKNIATKLSGTVAVSVAAAIPTNADITNAGGAGSTKALAVGGTYHSTRLALTDSQSAGFTLDSDGSLIVTSESLVQLPSALSGSGNLKVSLAEAGSLVIGKVGIDQTTPGTTNAVYMSGKASTPTLRINVGIIQSVTAANAVNASAYAVIADRLTIDNTTANALLVDFSITPTFGTPPTSGALQLIAVDWSLAATPAAGAAPTALLLGKVVGTFSPQPAASNTTATFVCRLDNVALSPKTDYYIYNGTNQTLSTGWMLSAQCWTIGN